MRLDAYYFSFYKTKSDSINKILSAIADAGNRYHNTEYWSDILESRDDCKSFIDLIQDSADSASKHIEMLESALEREAEITNSLYSQIDERDREIETLRMDLSKSRSETLIAINQNAESIQQISELKVVIENLMKIVIELEESQKEYDNLEQENERLKKVYDPQDVPVAVRVAHGEIIYLKKQLKHCRQLLKQIIILLEEFDDVALLIKQRTKIDSLVEKSKKLVGEK